jgi:hypothetical protein
LTKSNFKTTDAKEDKNMQQRGLQGRKTQNEREAIERKLKKLYIVFHILRVRALDYTDKLNTN